MSGAMTSPFDEVERTFDVNLSMPRSHTSRILSMARSLLFSGNDGGPLLPPRRPASGGADCSGHRDRRAGPGGVSLRDLARRAGVSHAAPAHHFGDKAGVLTAVAAEGYHLLADALSPPRTRPALPRGGRRVRAVRRRATAHTSKSCSAPTCTAPTIPDASRAARDRRLSGPPRDAPPRTRPARTSRSRASRHGHSCTASPRSGSTAPCPRARRRSRDRRPRRRRDLVPSPVIGTLRHVERRCARNPFFPP